MTKRTVFIAVLWSLKPAGALVAAFLHPGCLEGVNSDGVPHIEPAAFALGFLLLGWIFLASKRQFFNLFGWLFLVGSSMFSTVPLGRALDIHLPMFEWLLLFGVLIALACRLTVAFQGRSRTFSRVSLLATAVLGPAVVLPLLGPISPLYVDLTRGIVFGGLAVLAARLAHLHRHHKERP